MTAASHPRIGRDVKFTLMLAAVLVVLVIFIFLRNFRRRSSRPRAADVHRRHLRRDVSAGLSLDNLSLMALTLSVGFVVDDAIVMLENIVRHMEEGEEPLEAALKGSTRNRLHHHLDDPLAWRRCSFRCCSWAASSAGCCTNSPSPSHGDPVSGFVSLTLTPMLCSRFLKRRARPTARRFYRWSENVFDADPVGL